MKVLPMASQTKTVSGTTTTYVITDMEGNTLTLVASPNPITTQLSVTFTSSGALHSDGLALTSTLVLLLQTGLTP